MRPEDLLLAPHLTPEQVETILRPYGIKDPQAADRNLQLMAEDLPTREMLARLIGSLLLAAQKSPDPDAALNYFERFLGTFSPRTSLLTFLGETPEALELILLLCGTSPFSAEILIRNPENFYWLFDQLGSSWIKSRERYSAEAALMMSSFNDSTGRLRALARYKRREMLRIASRDILRLAPLAGTVAELSYLAETVIHLVFENCWQQLTEKFGTPVWFNQEGNQRTARFVVLGMGKLGGGELNYSSDIDLVYGYDGEQGHTVRADRGETSSTAGSLSNPEFFTRLAQAITQELSGFTEEGYFYRVDLRLRPEGGAGSIAVSLNACRNYYFSWGETFERMALIKARPVGGSQPLGEEFCAVLNPFIYRSFLDFAALEEIQEIKGRIETKLGSRKRQEAHVKLGAGGIREIEFFVQALQLIYGGRETRLQERSTLRALEKLLEQEYLSSREYGELLQAYLFLRDLEHKLQMVLHLQTHELPSSPDELYKCARRMGLSGSTPKAAVDQLKRTYRGHVRNVSRIFQDLIRFRRQGVARGQMREAALVMNKNLPETGAYLLLQPYRFRDLKSAWHQVGLLRDAPAFSHSPSKMRNLLANLIAPLLKALAESPDPDAGLSSFEQFAETFGDRESLYTLLNENRAALSRLVLLLASSPPLSSVLCRKPEFFDSLARVDLFVENKSLEEFRRELRDRLEMRGNPEERQRELRGYQQTEWFRIGMKDLLGQLSRAQVGKQLSALAEACLGKAFQLACAQLEVEKGFSRDWFEQHFAIMALGKFGGNDLSYSSDLDLVYFFQADSLEEAGEAQKRCVQLAERLDAILSVSTGEGSIYRIDTRLRPEGRKGELVVALHRYGEYLERRAENWERLALVRHRFVLGKGRLLRELRRLVREFVYQPDLTAETVRELVHVRHRMEVEVGKESGRQFHLKSGAGGLVDIEFSAQLLQLKYGGRLRSLRQANTLVALRTLAREGLLSEPAYRAHLNGYEFLRLLENRLRLTAPYGAAALARTPESLERYARLCRFERRFKAGAGERFEAHYREMTQAVRQAYESVVSTLLGNSSNP